MSGARARGSSGRPRGSRAALRAGVACALGVAAALLVACGSSSKGLIPTADAGPLQSDFEAVAQAAQSGNGNCTATEVALVKTLRDFHQLPANVDAGLRSTLSQGIENLRTRALALCSQHITSTATTGTTAKTTTTRPDDPDDVHDDADDRHADDAPRDHAHDHDARGYRRRHGCAG